VHTRSRTTTTDMYTQCATRTRRPAAAWGRQGPCVRVRVRWDLGHGRHVQAHVLIEKAQQHEERVVLHCQSGNILVRQGIWPYTQPRLQCERQTHRETDRQTDAHTRETMATAPTEQSECPHRHTAHEHKMERMGGTSVVCIKKALRYAKAGIGAVTGPAPVYVRVSLVCLSRRRRMPLTAWHTISR
jgi:hypothetical protein